MISKGASRAENATEQGPSSWTGPQLSCSANSTQHPFKEHQLAITLLRCASLQCTSEGPCKTWPFVHDQPLVRTLQPEPSVACKALLASEDAQRASLLCFYLISMRITRYAFCCIFRCFTTYHSVNNLHAAFLSPGQSSAILGCGRKTGRK